MKTVELLTDKPEFLKGSVITVDDKSAAALIEKGEAKEYDPSDPELDDEAVAGGQKTRRRRGRGNTATTVLTAEADMPGVEDPAEAVVEGEGGGDNV